MALKAIIARHSESDIASTAASEENHSNSTIICTKMRRFYVYYYRGNPMKYANLAEDIFSVSDFRSDITSMISKTKETHRPIVLTQRGKSSAVVLGIHDYQAMIDKFEFMEAILRSQKEIERGDFLTEEEANQMVFDK
jgi:prevent-host-death family protein